MKIFSLIYIGIVVCLCVIVYRIAFRIYLFLEKFFQYILAPFYLLQKLANRLSSLVPKIIRLLILLLVSVASCVFLVRSYHDFEDLPSFLITILDSTTLFSFIDMSSAGFAFKDHVSYPAMVAVAVSSFVSFLYGHHTTHIVESLADSSTSKQASLVSAIVITVLNSIFFLMSTLMAHYLKDWYASAADFVLAFFRDLVSGEGLDAYNGLRKVAEIAYRILLVVILSYAAIASFTIILQEYLSTIFYGLFSIFVIALIAVFFGNIINTWRGILGVIVCYLMLFLGDIVRNNSTINEAFIRMIKGDKRKYKI